jgi:hypothetical protein
LTKVFAEEELIGTIEVLDGPVGGAYNKENADIYVPNSKPDIVSVIYGDTDTHSAWSLPRLFV